MARRNRRLLGYAREMRKDPVWFEHILWQELRRRRFGVRFRRQEPIGPFIADFVCFTKMLVIELDGNSHDDRLYDAKRDAWFHEHGFFVLRIANDHIRDDLEGALDLIQQALSDPDSIDDPLNLKGLYKILPRSCGGDGPRNEDQRGLLADRTNLQPLVEPWPCRP